MKLRTMILILTAILAMTIFTGCGQSEPAEIVAVYPTEKSMEVVPDTTLDYHEHNVQFYNYDNGGKNEVVISDESVPLASAPTGGAVSKRQAESIAIVYKGFNQDSISFLHTKYVDEDVDTPYFHVSFQNDGVNYVVHVDEATGAVLSAN